MSRQKYWWSHVKWMIRFQPEREAELRRMQEAVITANYNAMPRGSEPSRTTENLGTVTLGNPADREMRAVQLAVDETMAMKDGEDRMKLIDLVFWKRTHTLTGACIECHISDRQGQRWHADFIHLVAKNIGFE